MGFKEYYKNDLGIFSEAIFIYEKLLREYLEDVILEGNGDDQLVKDIAFTYALLSAWRTYGHESSPVVKDVIRTDNVKGHPDIPEYHAVEKKWNDYMSRVGKDIDPELFNQATSLVGDMKQAVQKNIKDVISKYMSKEKEKYGDDLKSMVQQFGAEHGTQMYYKKNPEYKIT
jgi:hypothetical protein